MTPTTRVAYAKFMKRKLKSDFNIREERAKRGDSSSSFALEDEVFESTTEPPVIRLRPKSKKIVGDEQKVKDPEKEGLLQYHAFSFFFFLKEKTQIQTVINKQNKTLTIEFARILTISHR